MRMRSLTKCSTKYHNILRLRRRNKSFRICAHHTARSLSNFSTWDKGPENFCNDTRRERMYLGAVQLLR
jgi:hypothetical protein